jgi:H/ACA ribonucleoprotein complex subunit 3
MKRILKCPKCREYTTKETCPKCGAKAVNIKPPKYSPKDAYAGYRRKAKQKELKSQGRL